MKLYYDSEDEFLADVTEEDLKSLEPPEYSDTEKRKRHAAIMNGAMRAKWSKTMLRECPHPGVKEKYGTGEVSVWVCMSCTYAHRYPDHGGLSCDFGKQ